MKNKHSLILSQGGSVELIALGLLAALIIVLALPIFSDILGPDTSSTSNSIEYRIQR